MIDDPATSAAMNALISILFASLAVQSAKERKTVPTIFYLLLYGLGFAMFVVRLKEALS